MTSFSQPTAAAAPTESRRQRASKAWLPIAGFLAGFAAAYFWFREGVPLEGAEYLSLAVLAGLDSVFGGIRAGVEHRFRSDVFLSGFLVNMILAVSLVWLGKKIGVDDLWLAAVVTLGGRMFLNLSVIRRHWLERSSERGDR